MKTIYIPKGECVCYQSLTTEHLIVKGRLDVVDGIYAKQIDGDGLIFAGSIHADTIRADELDAGMIVCDKLLAKRVSAPEVFASSGMAISSFLSASYVETPKLTVAISEIDVVNAQEVINLPPKKRGLMGTLIASAWRSFWLSLVTKKEKSVPMDADYVQVEDEASPNVADESTPEEEQEIAPELKEQIQKTVCDIMEQQKNVDEANQMEQEDFELKRFIALFKMNRDSGYTLRIVPGTPEENAPVFDFDQETILRTAA